MSKDEYLELQRQLIEKLEEIEDKYPTYMKYDQALKLRLIRRF